MVQDPILEETLFAKDMDGDSSDETLSLCDIPLYNNQSVEEYWDHQDAFSSESSQGSSSMSSQHDAAFEFFSQELNPSLSATATVAPEEIIFCGKFIPYKQQTTIPKEEKEEETASESKLGYWGMFRWKLFGGERGRLTDTSNQSKKSTVLIKHNGKPQKKRHNTKRRGFHVNKMPILATSSSSSRRARWHMFLFGISRFSTEVDLRDIKSRQSLSLSRNQNQTQNPSELQSQSSNDKNIDGLSKIGSGLWGILKVLSCGGNQDTNTMVVASITCNSRV